jgi:transposase-like protein
MGQTPRVFSREFKLDVCRQWAAGSTSCAELVRTHGVSQSVLYRWRAAYAQDGEHAFAGPGSISASGERGHVTEALLRQQIAELEQALGKMSLENQLLKKGRILAASRNATP